MKNLMPSFKKVLIAIILMSSGNVCLSQVITSISPTSGPVGTSVTINGTGFLAEPSLNVVYFGAVKATVTAATSTSLSVNVPAGAGSIIPVSITTFNRLTISSITSATPFFTITHPVYTSVNFAQT
ncbi:MAG: IPT/TIG domain-containing protein, partial [Mariniphaga sp.]